MNAHKSLSYRADIDGLRAIAILLVLGFHAFPTYIHGGFVGVDVFFVISGYLISGVIFGNLKKGSFSLVDFFTRRIRRIFPALLTVLTFCIALGGIFLMSDERILLAKHIAGGAGFLSNFVLWKEAGYFDASANTKPLLHLWSLGIEEQFYFLWPLTLMALYRFRSRLSPVIGMGILLLASFCCNIWLSKSDLMKDFYFPQSRFWELIIGALLAWRQPKVFSDFASQKKWFSSLGLILILAGAFFLDKSKVFPGWWALLPTSGAAVLILSGPDAWINRHLLQLSPMKWIGLLSYPLYLWHWPLLVFTAIALGHPISSGVALLVLGVSLLLSWATFHLVETPIRFQNNILNKYPAIILGFLAFLGCSGYIIYSHPTILPNSARDEYVLYFNDDYWKSSDVKSAYRLECDFYDTEKKVVKESISQTCFTPKPNLPTIFIWGDSHAQHLNYGLEKTFGTSVNLLQVATSGCPPDIADRPIDDFGSCNRSNRFAIAKMAEIKPDLVVIAQKNAHHNQDWKKIADFLTSIGVKQVILLGPVPHWDPYLYKVIARNYWTNTPSRISTNLDQSYFDVDKVMKLRTQTLGNLHYISMLDGLCNVDGCLAFTDKGRKLGLMSADYGHFTLEGSAFVSKQILFPLISEILKIQLLKK